jgi:hypothetical protein
MLEKEYQSSRAAWEGSLKSLRLASSKCLEDLRFAWPLVWPDKGSGLFYRPVCCGGVFSLLQCFLHWLFPNMLGNLTEMLLSPESPGQWWCLCMTSLFSCLFLKEYLCKCFQSWLWLPVALRSENIVSEGAVTYALHRPEYRERWATGSFLSDLSKGGSPNACLEIVLFIWIPITINLLTTSVDLWWNLGTLYGFCVTMIGLS